MPYTAPKVYRAETLTGTYSELTGIQSVNITRGRQRSQDPFSGSTCVIELIPANSYAIPLALGQFVDIRDSNSAASPCYYAGRITDIQRRYDVPYNSGTGAAPGDRITLVVSGGLGVVGANITNITTNLLNGYDAISQISGIFAGAVYVFINAPYNFIPPDKDIWSGVFTSGQTIQAGTSGLSVVSKLLNMAQWIADDYDQTRAQYGGYNYGIVVQPPGASGTPITFTDDGSAGFKYQTIEYLSSLQSSFSTIAVEPDGLTKQFSTNVSSTLNNTLTVETYDQTTTQAKNLADYLLTVSTQSQPAPFVIETSSAASDTAGELGRFTTYPIGTAATVKFRGSTVFAMVQGWSIAYYADMARVRCYLSPSLGTWFTLNSTAFGVLDTNRLGYP